MTVETISMLGSIPSARVRLIDQTLLPAQEIFLLRDNYKDLAEDIQRLAVRGAPAIGVAGAFAVVLAVQDKGSLSADDFRKELRTAGDYISATRPTAVNLSWAVERVIDKVDKLENATSAAMLEQIEKEALSIWEEDRRLCDSIGVHAQELIKDGSRILTHCNAGALATAGIGTALAGMYKAKEAGKKITVYVDETRPLLQGARLTAWELTKAAIDAILICDNMAATVMARGLVDLVITGADRIAANGDAANKIGTYGVASLARHHGIPFYIAAPFSTFDLNIDDGDKIPIEERNPEEVSHPFGVHLAPDGIKVFNPAFDVTPAELIAGFITDRGIIRPPYTKNISAIIGS